MNNTYKPKLQFINYEAMGSPAHQPISPVHKKYIQDSAITNVFDDFVKSTTSISQPITHTFKQPYQSSQTHKNIQPNLYVNEDPQSDNEWKNKYQLLYKNYQIANRKLEAKTKQVFKMQQTINNQSKAIRQMQQQNVQLNNRYSGLMEQTQRGNQQRWGNNITNGSNNDWGYGNMGAGQINRFYVEELERKVDDLQKQNRRLSEIVMRKVKNSFNY